jgi:hypothetical protein
MPGLAGIGESGCRGPQRAVERASHALSQAADSMNYDRVHEADSACFVARYPGILVLVLISSYALVSDTSLPSTLVFPSEVAQLPFLELSAAIAISISNSCMIEGYCPWPPGT